MPGTKTSILSLIFAAALLGQSPNYLPLDPGNVWVYRSPLGVATVEAGTPSTFAGQNYTPLTGLPGANTVWLRNTPEGRIMMWDADNARETLWLDTTLPEGVDSPTAVNPCVAASRIESRQAAVKVPLGEFSNTLSVRYTPGRCADTGVLSDYFLPSIGILQRTLQTFAGPRTLDLVYARVGATVLSIPETAFSLALTPAAGALHARITLRHTGAQPLGLVFPSGQQFDLTAYDENGKLVYQWSEDQRFIQALTRVSVSGEKVWTAEVPASRLAPGRYVIRAWLPTIEGDLYTASAVATVPKD